MLTYRLTGTTEEYGVDHDEPHQSQPANNPHQHSDAESSRTMVRPEDGAALLTCRNKSEATPPEKVNQPLGLAW
jgi:hypothetical protein